MSNKTVFKILRKKVIFYRNNFGETYSKMIYRLKKFFLYNSSYPLNT